VEQARWEADAREGAIVFWSNTCLREAMAGWRAGVARKQYRRELSRQALLVMLRSSLLKVNLHLLYIFVQLHGLLHLKLP